MARIATLLLVVIPFLPELLIFAAAFAAKLSGCHPDQKDICLVGPVSANGVMSWALWASASSVAKLAAASNGAFVSFFVAVFGWLVICHTLLLVGWVSVRSRLLLGFGIMAVFAVLPYFGPMWAIASVTDKNCEIYEGGGTCMAFGGFVGTSSHNLARETVALVLLTFVGAPLALGVFAVYGVVVVSLGLASAKSGVRSI